jgi:hypothetical protein
MNYFPIIGMLGGGQVSIVEYFEHKYKHKIKYPIMPLIQIMPREKNLLSFNFTKISISNWVELVMKN